MYLLRSALNTMHGLYSYVTQVQQDQDPTNLYMCNLPPGFEEPVSRIVPISPAHTTHLFPLYRVLKPYYPLREDLSARILRDLSTKNSLKICF